MSMSDPLISLHDSDDPDSRAMKKGLGLIFWPGAGLLMVLTVTVYVFQVLWLAKVLIWYAGIWTAAHLMFRPSKFGAELAACLWALRDVFAAATAFLANSGLAAQIARLNAGAKATKQDNQAPLTLYTPLAAEAAAPAAVDVNTPPLEPRSEPPNRGWRIDVDWGRFGAALLNPRIWLLLAAGWVAFMVASSLHLFGRSGREVAADAETNIAKAEVKTANAEITQRERALERSDALEARRDAIHQQSEAARVAIEANPDNDAGFAAYAELAQRLRDDSARAAAAALQDYNSSLRP